ncbi:Transposase [Paenibacillus typhae]|uniref:Uncharacterized protein n=1 Tax=Paenibacillus typhae TaxID=1174501 RepID=A0A1G9H285_9BACL|nr:hypothetical protein SAMN05216192_17115 [Paenibacillus typhae]
MIVRVKPAHSKKGHMAAGLMSVIYVLFSIRQQISTQDYGIPHIHIFVK